MRDTVLWRKQSRIIMLLADALHIDAERALDLFYSTKIYQQLSDPKYGLQLMSDGYILEDLIDEIDREINGFMITHQYVDTVSQFYIEFLRYANNDKGLGIVLTPPHITDLFAELAGVDKNSIVLDNCCGTGGFLTESFKVLLNNYEKSGTLTTEAREFLSKKCFYGVDVRDENISRM